MKQARPIQVTVRTVKARAMQFKYHENSDNTVQLVRLIQLLLRVKISSSYDPQAGTGYHLDIGVYSSKLISQHDWVVVDSFGRADVIPDKEFKVYYEPEVTE